MRAVVQRVSKAQVDIDGKTVGRINTGLMVLIAFCDGDDQKILEWMANKLMNLRVFPDDEGKMNLSVQDIQGEILLVPNFTLYGTLKKGFRPNFMKSASPDFSLPMFETTLSYLKEKYPINIKAGQFGANMQVELLNDGPVTVIIEKEKQNG